MLGVIPHVASPWPGCRLSSHATRSPRKRHFVSFERADYGRGLRVSSGKIADGAHCRYDVGLAARRPDRLPRPPPISFTTIQRKTAMMAATQFDNVSVIKRANVYFDGKCVSHTVLFADGSRKTIGVILPGTLNFGTDAPELMEVQAGQCRIRLDGSSEWQTYSAGESFSVPGKSRFDIDVIETLDYVCSYL
jgi:purine/pyrimidine-nucleoside phosphorylase